MAEDSERGEYMLDQEDQEIFFALIDSDNNGQVDEKILIANNLTLLPELVSLMGIYFFFRNK